MWDSYSGNISVNIDDSSSISAGKFDAAYFKSARSDYFTLTITNVEQTSDGLLIEATFECKMHSASNNPIEIKNGYFRVVHFQN